MFIVSLSYIFPCIIDCQSSVASGLATASFLYTCTVLYEIYLLLTHRNLAAVVRDIDRLRLAGGSRIYFSSLDPHSL